VSRSVLYGSSPLLASKTPVWRSKFIVGAIALGFAGLAGRAAYVQVFGNDFFQRQGEVRFARTLELPANRGQRTWAVTRPSCGNWHVCCRCP
jgi:cell division protein FtsI (penicillin-binding protein 3)